MFNLKATSDLFFIVDFSGVLKALLFNLKAEFLQILYFAYMFGYKAWFLQNPCKRFLTLFFLEKKINKRPKTAVSWSNVELKFFRLPGQDAFGILGYLIRAKFIWNCHFWPYEINIILQLIKTVWFDCIWKWLVLDSRQQPVELNYFKRLIVSCHFCAVMMSIAAKMTPKTPVTRIEIT